MIVTLLALSSIVAVPIVQDEEVQFSGVGGLKLSGTLTRPEAGDTLPAVLILPGSGPTDRNGNSIAINVPIELHRQIAERLASEGIASLRFDKRAVMRYSAEWPKDLVGINDFFGWDKFAGDATAAFQFLRTQKRIDAKRVGILGHSEGGLLTLQIASDLAKSGPPKAIVLLGTCGRTFGPVIHDQVDANLKANKVPDEMYRRLMAYTDAASAALATGKPVPPNPPKELASLFNPYGEKLMRAYHTVDPLALAANYAGPVLVANGAADAQVSAVKDAPLLVGVFKKRAKGTVELRIVPKASHCFKESADAFSGPVVPGLLDGVAGFLRREL